MLTVKDAIRSVGWNHYFNSKMSNQNM